MTTFYLIRIDDVSDVANVSPEQLAAYLARLHLRHGTSTPPKQPSRANIDFDDIPDDTNDDPWSAPWNQGYRDLTDGQWQALAENSV